MNSSAPGEFKVSSLSSLFNVSVDYEVPLKNMIAVGNYDRVDRNIKEKYFPIYERGKKDLKMQYVHFEHCTRYWTISLGDATILMSELRLRPANLAEFLAFGTKFPFEQNKNPLIGIGQWWQPGRFGFGHRYFSYLYSLCPKRILDLVDYEYYSLPAARFVGVCE